MVNFWLYTVSKFVFLRVYTLVFWEDQIMTTSDLNAGSTDFWGRYLAAGNPDTSLAELYSLSHDCNYAIRARVAQNCALPMELMIKLIQDKHAEVRIGLAENPKVPYTLLQRLASDEDLHVRYDLAENPHIPALLLEQLSADENPYVASRANQTLSRMYPNQSLTIGSTDIAEAAALSA
jgi:hypothetical protein